ncbi:hypothetical protein [Phaeovulum sp.]|uniref:hypothetical protein n=1 Tax=Phaeovulum sp. TaxID=2934796 RepID=UPI0039E2D28A
MTRFLLLFPFVAALAACETPGQNALAGAAIGAAVADDDDRLAGAALGGAAGLVAGELVRQSNTAGKCVYRDARGREFIAAC